MTEDELSRKVNELVVGASDYFARLDNRVPGTSRMADRADRHRHRHRSARSAARRLPSMGVVIIAVITLTLGFGFTVGPIGIGGLFAVIVATLFILLFFSLRSVEKPIKPFSEEMSNPDVVRRLNAYLGRNRDALPSPATRQVDAITRQLPLLESRLGELDALDPLAQDARRLMGKHLPDLIDHYERVPTNYRSERDSAGMTVDERLVAGLDAAKEALDDISAKLAQKDLTAFETQGRFIESRYKDGAGLEGE